MSYEDEYNEGYQAAIDNLPEHYNPYPGDIIEHEYWSDGYDDGIEDLIQESRKYANR